MFRWKRLHALKRYTEENFQYLDLVLNFTSRVPSTVHLCHFIRLTILLLGFNRRYQISFFHIGLLAWDFSINARCCVLPNLLHVVVAQHGEWIRTIWWSHRVNVFGSVVVWSGLVYLTQSWSNDLLDTNVKRQWFRSLITDQYASLGSVVWWNDLYHGSWMSRHLKKLIRHWNELP
jgi:hypothetical protein